MARAVGIDLGTTNSVISALEGGEPAVIANAEGNRTTPSIVAFKGSDVLVGEVAKRQAVTNPENTIRSVKRHMGTKWTTNADGTDYTAQEIAARILMKLKRDAEAFLGDTVDAAVITVPAYFNDAQRQATQEAGVIAGLEVLRIINEPTAAALAYGLEKGADETILVYDLGGGTFDVSLLEIGDGVFEVKATSGDTHLGGDDWDDAIIKWLADGFNKEHGVDLLEDPTSAQRLREGAEKAKIELSTLSETEINLPFINGPDHLLQTLTRSEFQRMTAALLNRTKGPFEQVIKDAGVKIADIDHVILVGGSTRMPSVTDLVKKLTGKIPHKGVNPDEVVASGAAIQAGVLRGHVTDVLLLDVTPLSLGIETMNDITNIMIERNTTIPTSKTEIYTTAAPNQPEVEINVLQGERASASDNKSLGKFRLTGIPPAPARVPQIEVTFDIDANGIVSVSAKDKGTGREQAMTITGGTALAKDEIDDMVANAEKYAEEDAAKREFADTRGQADQLLYQIETLQTENEELLNDEEKASIAAAADALSEELNDDAATNDSVRAKIEELITASQGFSERIYAQAQEEQAAEEAGESEDDDIMDAEVIEEDEAEADETEADEVA